MAPKSSGMIAKKKGLGRGLDSLLKIETPATQTLPLERLKPNRVQPQRLNVA